MSTLKDKQAELRKLQLEEKQKEHLVLRDTLKKGDIPPHSRPLSTFLFGCFPEIDALYKKRASIRESFRQQMSAYLMYKQTEVTQKGEESRRQEEGRRATREARLRRR